MRVPEKIKILIAEHDQSDLELLVHELKGSGLNYEYKAVRNETAYIAAIKSFTPDIILADYTFPSFDGPTAFKIRQMLAPNTPFIIVSGTIGEEKAIELIKAGVTDYVLKDSIITLGFKVHRALDDFKDDSERKRLTLAVEYERERYRDIIFRSPSSIGILKGPDHVFAMVNPVYLNLIGRHDVIGKAFKTVLPELAEQGFVTILDEVYRSGIPFFANEKMMKLDRNSNGVLCESFVNVVYQPYLDHQGTIEGVLFFTIDVSEQVRSRKIIEESENRFRAIIEKSTEMVTLSTKDGKILYISPSATNVFGYSLKDLADGHAFNLIHPDDIQAFMEKRQRIIDIPGGSFKCQLRLAHKNGGWVWGESVLTNMLNEPGVNAMVSNFRDIMDKKITEQRQEFDNNNLNALINNTEDLLWSVDKDFNLITFNQPFENVVKKLSGQKLIKGSSILAIAFPAQQVSAFRVFYERAFAGEVFTEVNYMEFPSEFWSEISFYPIRTGGVVTGTACHSRNITDSKKAEKSLVQSEKRYRQILETAQEGIWLIDENNITTFVNQKMCEILEYTKEEMIGRSNLTFKSPEDLQTGLDQLERRKKGIKETLESRFVTKSGRDIWAQVSANPMMNDDGEYIGGLAMITDITERKNAGDQMLNVTNRLLLATKSAAMGIWEWDIHHDHIEWDNAMSQLYQIKDLPFNSTYEGWISRLHPDDRDRVHRDFQLAVTGKNLYDTEFRITRRDNTVHYIKAKGIIEKDAKGNTIKLIGVNWDITAQKEGEQQLKLLESVITNTTDSVLITEAEPFDEPGHKIVYVNKAFTDMTGYSSDEVLGKSPRILQGPRSDKVDLKRFSDTIRKWQSSEITVINYKKNGDEFWINLTVSPVANEKGWFTHWIAIEKDVTERKLSEIRLRELNENLQKHAKQLAVSNAELEQFAYVASHDLQEPLRMITGFLHQLEKKYGETIDERGKKYIDFAVDGAKRMRQIILDLLEYSRVGRAELSVENINLNELVGEIQILFRKQIEETNAVFYVDDLPEMFGHVSPIRQVFQNLISNGLKYNKKDEPAKIIISVKNFPDYWQFQVADNGIGIESDYFDRIFVIFQRLHSKEEFSGTGMGLAIAKKIIEAWGGKIWLTSEPGQGSDFYFTLPKKKDNRSVQASEKLL